MTIKILKYISIFLFLILRGKKEKNGVPSDIFGPFIYTTIFFCVLKNGKKNASLLLNKRITQLKQ